jgi:ribosomal protein L44E
MRTCPVCGGTMYRQSKQYLKTTNDFKLRLRCKSCKSFKSIYMNELGQVIQETPRANGRPFMPFVFA